MNCVSLLDFLNGGKQAKSYCIVKTIGFSDLSADHGHPLISLMTV